MTIGIIDYGVGNLFSLKSSFGMIGEEARVVKTPEEMNACEKLVLPGVGAFGDAMDKLVASGMRDELLVEARSGKPLLGICLGMQLLLERSFEFGEHAGLGLIEGSVRPIADVILEGLNIPHIGWNALSFVEPKHPLFDSVEEGSHVYFVHSFYAAECESAVIARTEYGAQLTAAVADGAVMGCQFHPEKSGSVGMGILRSFCAYGKGGVGC